MNELNFQPHFESLVSLTLNQDIASVKALLTSENGEIKADASDILKSMLASHIENVKANADFSQNPKYKERISNLQIEYSNKAKKETDRLKSELEAIKGAKTNEELKWIDQLSVAKAEGEANVKKVLAELEGFKSEIEKQKNTAKLKRFLKSEMPFNDFLELSSETVDSIIEFAMMKKMVGGVVEKDGKMYLTDHDGQIMVQSTGHPVSAKDIGTELLVRFGARAKKQNPISGAGNKNSPSAPKNWRDDW